MSFRRTDWREDVSAYLDDELTPRDRARVEARLAESAEMQAYLTDLDQMRTVLRRFDPAQSATPFQLTPEMIDDPARIRVRPASTARALRLSMSTAAIGVATFAAFMVFDAVDSPTVNFTTTSADAEPTRVPTAAVVTDEVEVQAQAGETSDEAASPTSSEPQAVSAAAEEAPEEERTTVAAVASEQADQQQAAQEAVEQEEAEQQAEAYQEEQAQQEAQESADDSAVDPSRRALTAGRSSGDGQAKSVNVEDVVAEQEEAEAVEQAQSADEVSADAAAEQAADSTDEQRPEAQQSAAASPAEASSEDEHSASARTETRSVATSVAQGESDWPLEQRPRSSTVRLARDPSWELPVQIVLAAVAISSAVFWLVLTIADRRRRA
ncbi:MAG: zf-HC2 domain-containing protein [Chloroflexi bacterium]|nr:zf-HC2 domain-containing protein [Chloroflexota bacterium]MCY3589516.1 zf-HC2 domain-containing protein [Chloroflexota bacterium]MCY3685076.1 zf-HC2 domain-containing protein [Chloroflexota bacterium]MDE2707730.1 zf-HC2 domain-containing protein [Chloroflexota bacterium]